MHRCTRCGSSKTGQLRTFDTENFDAFMLFHLRISYERLSPTPILWRDTTDSPAFEVLDVTLPTTLAQVTKGPKLAGGILYLSNQNPAPEVVYHPTIVGEEFLVKVGAAI